MSHQTLAGLADLVTPLFDLIGGEEHVNHRYYQWQGREEGDDRKMFRKLRSGKRQIRPRLAHRLGMFFGSMDPWWSGMAMLYAAGHFSEFVAAAAIALEENAIAPVNILREVMVAATPFEFDNLPLRFNPRDAWVTTFGMLSIPMDDHDSASDWEIYSRLLPAVYVNRQWRMIFLGRIKARKTCIENRTSLDMLDTFFANWSGVPSSTWSTDSLAAYEVARSRIIPTDGKIKRLQDWLGRPYVPEKSASDNVMPIVVERRGQLPESERVSFVSLSKEEIAEIEQRIANSRMYNGTASNSDDSPPID
jgi:hypothetical protein